MNMIKRRYFMAVEKNWNNGHGSYSFDSVTMDYSSWLPNPDKVFAECAARMEEKLKGTQGEKVQIIAFNRI
jgi:hypothetical protein